MRDSAMDDYGRAGHVMSPAAQRSAAPLEPAAVVCGRPRQLRVRLSLVEAKSRTVKPGLQVSCQRNRRSGALFFNGGRPAEVKSSSWAGMLMETFATMLKRARGGCLDLPARALAEG